MKYILVGLAFGAVWAAIQLARGTEPPGIVGPILLCGAFGALLWGARVVALRLRGTTVRRDRE